MSDNDSMLDLARRTCQDAEECNPTGEFPRPNEEGFGKADDTYNGEYRYVNLGPAKIRAMLKEETDPDEVKALRTAMAYWASKAPARSGGNEGGEPYRGEPREAIHAESMSDLAKDVKPVEHVYPGDLGAIPDGMADGGVIDFDQLVNL